MDAKPIQGRCKTCKHWKVEDVPGWSDPGYTFYDEESGEVLDREATNAHFGLEIRECTKVLFFERPGPGEAAVFDGSEYNASLITPEDFGCTQWEEFVSHKVYIGEAPPEPKVTGPRPITSAEYDRAQAYIEQVCDKANADNGSNAEEHIDPDDEIARLRWMDRRMEALSDAMTELIIGHDFDINETRLWKIIGGDRSYLRSVFVVPSEIDEHTSLWPEHP